MVELLQKLKPGVFPVLLDSEPDKDIGKRLSAASKNDITENRGIFLNTSGTTGAPKLVFVPRSRIWDSTNKANTCRSWGLLFPAYKMAGLQVIAQTLASGAKLLVPKAHLSPAEKISYLVDMECEGVSATPSFWKLAVDNNRSKKSSFRRVTLGGEIADQKLLDILSQQFPGARISHVYATSETGAVFSVSDGIEGFPKDYVGKTFRNGKSIQIVDGRLHVSVPNDGGRNVVTDDLVLETPERFKFNGRESGVINVGGNRVSLREVERHSLSFSPVLDCRASALPNVFTSQCVRLEVVWRDSNESSELMDHLSTLLPRYALPVVIHSVEAFKLNDSQKRDEG